MKSLVSILIPAYNAQKWISASIESAISQTWETKEIIVVDDGSTDDTFQIAREFEGKSVKVVTQENRGASAARNMAYSLSQGDYIQWLDADDLLHPHKIEVQLVSEDLNRDETTLSCGIWGAFLHRKYRAKFNPSPLWNDLTPREWIVSRFRVGGWVQPSCWLIGRKLAEKTGPWDERLSMADDGEYSTRLVATSKYVRFKPSSICYYRYGWPTSLSSKRSSEAWRSLSLCTKLCVNHLLHLEESDETRKACVNFLKRVRSFLYTFSGQPVVLEIIEDFEELIGNLGGEVSLPSERRLFWLVRKAIGRRNAAWVKQISWHQRLSLRRKWDGVLAQFDNLLGRARDERINAWEYDKVTAFKARKQYFEKDMGRSR
jgi:glycosyltransferase involved in cell wall biosynthesis